MPLDSLSTLSGVQSGVPTQISVSAVHPTTRVQYYEELVRPQFALRDVISFRAPRSKRSSFIRYRNCVVAVVSPGTTRLIGLRAELPVNRGAVTYTLRRLSSKFSLVTYAITSLSTLHCHDGASDQRDVNNQ
nr:hypothetical protein CFP56_22269 [Quercus suber]